MPTDREAIEAARRIVETVATAGARGMYPFHTRDYERVARYALSLSDQNAALRAALRKWAIDANDEHESWGYCHQCQRNWYDGIEAHEPGCLAVPAT